MLLIQSDFIKSVWFVVFPIVDYTHGPITSDSAFCQVSGWFVAVGIESSDVAVLLIALHPAMSVFRPRSGLYPYRWLAYAIYVCFPLLTASLAFVDGRGYDNLGYYCYLPNDRRWANLSLSWVPRYILFFIIIATSVCTYAYLQGRISHYERRDSAAYQRNVNLGYGVAEPPTVYPELLHSVTSSRRPSGMSYRTYREHGPRHGSLVQTLSGHGWLFTAGTSHRTSSDAIPRQPIAWKLPGFTGPSTPVSSRPESEEQDPCSPPLPNLDLPPPILSPPRRSSVTAVSYFPSSSDGHHQGGTPTSDEDATTPSTHALSTTKLPCRIIRAKLSSHPIISSRRNRTCSLPSIAEPPLSPSSLTPILLHQHYTSSISIHRAKTRRQLCTLFIYPLIYIIIWIFPFVNHALGYGRDAQPFWLLVLSLVPLAVQGTVDCVVFSAREKPWRETRRGGFWAAVGKGWDAGRASGSGRTREEMLVDGRIARERRKGEVVDEVTDGLGVKRVRGKGVRHWWDVEEVGDEEDESQGNESRSG